MKNLILLGITFFGISQVLFAQTKAGKIDTEKHATYYTCPKHSDIISDKPGKCPKCGMDLSLSQKEQLKTKVTKSYTCPMHVDVVAHNPGKCPKCGRKLDLSPKEQMRTEAMKIYTCPMHPDVALNKEGVCPKCGKELVEKKNQ